MSKIYKYVLTPESHIGQGLSLKPLAVGWQDDDVVLWAEASEQPEEISRILGVRPNGLFVIVIPTGQETPPAGFEYVGTAHHSGNPLVFHVYSRPMLDKGDNSK